MWCNTKLLHKILCQEISYSIQFIPIKVITFQVSLRTFIVSYYFQCTKLPFLTRSLFNNRLYWPVLIIVDEYHPLVQHTVCFQSSCTNKTMPFVHRKQFLGDTDHRGHRYFNACSFSTTYCSSTLNHGCNQHTGKNNGNVQLCVDLQYFLELSIHLLLLQTTFCHDG